MRFTVETQEVAPPYPRWPDAVVQMQELIEPGMRWEVEEDASYISATLSEQHRDFHSQHISFLPLATKDQGRVWTSILAGRDGQPGFVKTPTPRLMQVVAEPSKGDPAWRTLVQGAQDVLVAGVGVELTTRRRNKLAGRSFSDSGAHLALGRDYS